jgi:putative Holliday junction resolvase
MRYLGIDFGLRRIGLSISDEEGKIAFGLTTIEDYGIKNIISYIEEIIKKYRIEKIILGFPKNMDGSPGILSKDLYEFIKRIKESIEDIEIILWDERLTTLQGERIKREIGKRKKSKGLVDKIAATLILQNYLDYMNREKM